MVTRQEKVYERCYGREQIISVHFHIRDAGCPPKKSVGDIGP